jgi:hypothetical protein
MTLMFHREKHVRACGRLRTDIFRCPSFVGLVTRPVLQEEEAGDFFISASAKQSSSRAAAPVLA